MRMRRVIGKGSCCYHVMSRVIERRFILGDKEKRKFMELLRRQSEFSGVVVLSHCILDNHFHLLLEVPESPEEMSDDELANRMRLLYGTERADGWLRELLQARERGIEANVEWLRSRLLVRMYDLSVFVQEVKQRFTQWYNRRTSFKAWPMGFFALYAGSTSLTSRSFRLAIICMPLFASHPASRKAFVCPCVIDLLLFALSVTHW